jgi:hypothetical protein
VAVVGYVSDLQALYADVQAAICPVEGTGVNIKVMEALAYGKPVFAYPSSITGLPPGSETCVFPLTEASVWAILSDREALRRASQAARDYVASPIIRAAWAHLHDQLRDLANELQGYSVLPRR